MTRDGVEARWNRKWKYWSSFSRLDFEILIAIAMGSPIEGERSDTIQKNREWIAEQVANYLRLQGVKDGSNGSSL